MTIDSLAGTLSTYWPVVVVAGTTLGTVVGSVLTIWFRLRHERREEKKARREDATSTWDRLKETYDTRIEQLAKLSEDPANPRRERDHQRLLKRRRQFERQISSYQSQQALNRLVPRRSPGEALGVALDHKGRAELTVQLQSARLLTPGALTAADYQAQGDASWTLGRVADALTAYDRSLALRPDDPVTLANRGAVLRQLGRPA